MSMNVWTGMGRITHDLELRETSSGAKYLNFTIAVDDDYRPKDGSDVHTDFVSCIAWNGAAEFVSKYFGKGRMIAVTGRLTSDKYTDKDGNNRTSWKVKVDHMYFADSKKDGNDSGPSLTTNFAPVDDFNEELPF